MQLDSLDFKVLKENFSDEEIDLVYSMLQKISDNTKK